MDSLSFISDICGALKNIKRTGWVKHQIPLPESDADHMHRCAMCALLLSQPADPRDSYDTPDSNRFHPDAVDKTKLLRMAVTHDLCEALAGDITPFCDPTLVNSKHDKEDQAMRAIQKVVGNPLGEELYKLWKEYEDQKTVEAIYCKDIDKFEMVVQAFEYEKKYLLSKKDAQEKSFFTNNKNMNVMPTDYKERAKNFGLASPVDVLAALAQSDTIVLDVRRDDEIEQTGKVIGAAGGDKWKTTPCTPEACPQLEKDPSKFVGTNTETPILVYCRSGRRAIKAKEILQNSGYTNVINGGGYDDIQGMIKIDAADDSTKDPVAKKAKVDNNNTLQQTSTTNNNHGAGDVRPDVYSQPLRGFFKSTSSVIKTPLFRRLDAELRERREKFLEERGWDVTEAEKQKPLGAS